MKNKHNNNIVLTQAYKYKMKGCEKKKKGVLQKNTIPLLLGIGRNHKNHNV